MCSGTRSHVTWPLARGEEAPVLRVHFVLECFLFFVWLTAVSWLWTWTWLAIATTLLATRNSPRTTQPRHPAPGPSPNPKTQSPSPPTPEQRSAVARLRGPITLIARNRRCGLSPRRQVTQGGPWHVFRSRTRHVWGHAANFRLERPHLGPEPQACWPAIARRLRHARGPSA